jgi:RecB family exonuclease
MVEGFYASPYPAQITQELASELYLTWKVARRGILPAGRLDQVCLHPNGVLEVIDYKTGLTLPTPEEAENDPQTVLYHTLAADHYRHLNPTEVRITYLYLAGPVAITLAPERAAQLKRWAWIEEIAAMIRKDRADYEAGLPMEEAFPPNRGPGCQFCPMRAHRNAKFPTIPSLFPQDPARETPPLAG